MSEPIDQQTINEVEFDLVTLSLKGKRFTEAVNGFTQLILKTNSSEAWCGLGLSKFGLILDQTTLDEVFHCFSKARTVNPDRVREVEELVLQSATEVAGNLYSLYIEAVQVTRTHHQQRGRAAIATALGAVLTMRATYKNRVMGSIASAGFTALSYDSYLSSTASANEATMLYERVGKIVEQLKSQTRIFIGEETDGLKEFNKQTKIFEEHVVDALKSDDQKSQENQIAQAKTENINRVNYIANKNIELANNSSHPFHKWKQDALDLFNRKKYKAALPVINQALIFHKEHDQLLKVKEETLLKLQRRDVIMCVVPFIVVSMIVSFKIFGQDHFGLSLIVTGIIFGFLIFGAHHNRKDKLPEVK